jgi:protein-tyrosine-phosphatase
MSRALFEQAAAGRHTAESVHPPVIEVMRELDIDLSDRRPQRLSRQLAEQADVVVTMGCGDACPYVPGKRYTDWELPDPMRATHDDIRRRVRALVEELDRDYR